MRGKEGGPKYILTHRFEDDRDLRREISYFLETAESLYGLYEDDDEEGGPPPEDSPRVYGYYWEKQPEREYPLIIQWLKDNVPEKDWEYVFIMSTQYGG